MRRLLLGALLASMTLPVSASAAHRSPPKIPVCSALSRTAIAKDLGFAPLVLETRISHNCTFSAESPGQYLQALSIQIIPWSGSAFTLAESDAVESAEKEPGAVFDVVNKGLKVGKRAFFVVGMMTSRSLEPCGSENAPAPEPLEVRTGPICGGEPTLTHISVTGYGRSPGGAEPMVSVAAAAEQGHVTLISVINLVKYIISGKIH